MNAPPPPAKDSPSARGPRVGFHVSAFGSHQVLAALSALSACGFEGLEIYADTTHIFAERPDEFRQILDITGIGLAGVHGGGLLTSEEFRAAEVAEWTRLVEWTAAAGGSYAIFYGGESHSDASTDVRRAASFLNEVGRHAAALGVALCYEPDRRSPFRTKERIADLMARTDPAWVRLSADTAHLTSMGLDPALFLLSQRQRLGVVHLRDLRPVSAGARGEGGETGAGGEGDTAGTAAGDAHPYAELGAGTVDLEGVAEALRTVGFGGWVIGVVESPAKSAHDSARAAAAHLREFLGFEF